MERIQELFIQIAEPILGLVDGISSLVGGADNLAGILAGIVTTMVIYTGLQKLSAGYAAVMAARESVLAVIAGTKAIAEISAASAMTLGIGLVAIIGGIAAGAAAMYSSQSKAKNVKDAMIGPDGGLMVSGPKGTFSLDKEDSVIAGTDLDKTPERGGGGNSALISEVRTLIGINRQILAKSPVIEMSGTKVGEGINQTERAIQ